MIYFVVSDSVTGSYFSTKGLTNSLAQAAKSELPNARLCALLYVARKYYPDNKWKALRLDLSVGSP